jgi:high affinity choline transporter 7
MTINGLFFVDRLREKNYLTLIDALQHSYGRVQGGLVYLPSCVGDVCWTAAVLSALGSTLEVGVDGSRQITWLFCYFCCYFFT